FVGTVNEDWATESMAGDIFLLGTHAWQIRQVASGVVRVADAAGKPPTIPFWTGEAPARTPELSDEVSALRSTIDAFLTAGDAVVLSLGPHHSCPLADVPRFLNSKTVREVLEQAILDSPMFQSRWRWNLNRALIVLRWKGGRRNPPPLQRMEADDFMAALFPQAAACQENVTGPIEIPDHPIVRQTIHDTLPEGLDPEGLTALLDG